jgi:hypothetical protein
MNLSSLVPIAGKGLLAVIMSLSLLSCGNSKSPNAMTNTPSPNQLPLNNITYSSFRDTNGLAGDLTGEIIVELSTSEAFDEYFTNSIWLYWADSFGSKIGEAFLKKNLGSESQIKLFVDVRIPDGAKQLLLYPANDIGNANEGSLIPFHDFKGNASLSGPGGNEMSSWYYGENRPKINIHRQTNGLCVFDNGLVSVIDMNNQRDPWLLLNRGSGLPNNDDDAAFPSFDFMCDPEPINTERAIVDEVGVWTYSTLNDAMYYGTVVYDTFNKYLGEPPLEEKIRLRVHYGNEIDVSVFWDGAYANFSDAYLSYYSTATLDLIAHEVAHGVLGRISALKAHGVYLSDDARTLHEAFGDISGVMAKYELTGEFSWIHGEESAGDVRYLDRIVTESGAIPSHLDYEDAGDNYYKRIGMITYPFYKLTEKWGVETTYNVYLNSAKDCWQPLTTLTAAAECIKQQAQQSGLSVDDVVNAFKEVKIKLFEQGVLSHFTANAEGLRVSYLDDSQSTGQINSYLWKFGDGNTSIDANPVHTYAELGEYEVSLFVIDEFDNHDTFRMSVSVD